MSTMLTLIMPATWLTAAVSSVLPVKRLPVGLAAQALLYFAAAFVTRLVFQHHESRYQIAYFAAAAGLLEGLRYVVWRDHRPGYYAWAVEVSGAILGILIARVIAHHGYFGL